MFKLVKLSLSVLYLFAPLMMSSALAGVALRFGLFRRLRRLIDAGRSLRSAHHDLAALFEQSHDRASSGAVLRLAQLPGYLAALEQKRVLAMPGSAQASQSAELQRDYLEPLDIRASLEAPIFRHGEVVGVVRHEHTGSAREWSSSDAISSAPSPI